MMNLSYGEPVWCSDLGAGVETGSPALGMEARWITLGQAPLSAHPTI